MHARALQRGFDFEKNGHFKIKDHRHIFHEPFGNSINNRTSESGAEHLPTTAVISREPSAFNTLALKDTAEAAISLAIPTPLTFGSTTEGNAAAAIINGSETVAADTECVDSGHISLIPLPSVLEKEGQMLSNPTLMEDACNELKENDNQDNKS
mmetsp:Transcript_18624/g.42571  ORF Transcript_18624/g.42571 Transcript_18624/m.42571 type:complete len:154 (+) Transcript_18624:2049-2510(+)